MAEEIAETLNPAPTGPSETEPQEGKAEAQEVQETKRGRGRPRKNPAIPEADVIPRKPKGEKTAKSEKAAPASVEQSPDFYARSVSGIHMMLSLATGLDLSISDKDSATLGDAIYQVAKDSNLEFLTKYAPYINLAVTAAMIEIPIAVKAQAGLGAKKAQKEAVSQNVTPQGPGVESGKPLSLVGPVGPGGIEVGQSHVN